MKGGDFMQMERILIQLPKPLKAKLDALRQQGYTASGYIRALLEREFRTTTHRSQRKVSNGKTRD